MCGLWGYDLNGDADLRSIRW